MPEIRIRKPAARLILASEWYKTQPETPELKKIQGASTSSYRWNLEANTTGQIETILGILNPVIEELLAAGQKPAVIKPLWEMKSDVDHYVDQIKFLEAKEAKELKVKQAQESAQSRQWATEDREQTLSLYVENGRVGHLRQICEDYGLDYDDVQIRAALVAAFHAGAKNFHNAVNGLQYGLPNWHNVEEATTTIATRDKKLFDAARAKVAETPSTDA